MPTPDRVPARTIAFRAEVIVPSSEGGPKPVWTVRATIVRQCAPRPRFVVLPPSLTFAATFVADVTLARVAIGRRTIKPWDALHWYFELSAEHCAHAGVDTGDSVELQISPACEDTPDDLAALLCQDRTLLVAWDALAVTYRRQLAEWIRQAKRDETRQRRADDVVRRLRRYVHCKQRFFPLPDTESPDEHAQCADPRVSER